jgi:hypothetical protein
MTEIRCQMCGKQNPEDAEVCQFCQARLKPVWASKSSESFFEAEPESGPEEAVPEWLSSLRGPEESAPGQSSEEAPEADSFGGIESRETAGGEDWLSDLGKPEAVPPEVVNGIFDLQSEDDLSEWLSEPEKPVDEQTNIPSDEPGAEKPASFSEEEPGETAPGTPEEQFDWLTASENQKKEDEEQQPKGFSFEPGQTPPGEGEVPDWLTRMTLGEPEVPPDSQALPDWMKDATPSAQDEFDAYYSSAPAEAGASEPGVGEAGAPDASGVDWMTGIYGDQAAEPSEKSAAEINQPPTGQNDFPEWLSALGVSPEEEAPQVSWDFEQQAPRQPAGEAEPLAAGQTPDWLAGLGVASQKPLEGAEETPGTSPSAFTGFDGLSAGDQAQTMPDWLAKLDAEGTPTTGAGPSPFVPDEPEKAESEAEYLSATPDWLSQVGIDQGEIEEEQAPPVVGQAPDLEQGELPNWLEAMRPVEVAASEPYKDTSDGRLENEGPLAGLRGALPVGIHAVRQRRPTTSALKIQVPEEQQNRATVLQKLLEDESVAKPLPAPALAAIPMLTRIGILAVFVLASFFAFWLGDKQVPLPSPGLIPRGAQDFHDQVDALPAGVPVLVAVDYEPGFSGELDGAAVSVLGHLAGKGSLVIFVSTTYNGPALAQRLVQKVNRQPAFLQTPFTNYKNMGYIPGGVTGLAALAQAPQVVLPYDLQANSIWTTPPFDSSQGMGNFGMVVVITQDTDTARNWIEQVGPELGDKPLQMVVSAQAEPLVQPYYAGFPRQVTGIVTGLAGGVAYEVLQESSGIASQSWDAYSISLTLAVIIFLVGGVFGVSSFTLTQYKQAKAEGKA